MCRGGSRLRGLGTTGSRPSACENPGTRGPDRAPQEASPPARPCHAASRVKSGASRRRAPPPRAVSAMGRLRRFPDGLTLKSGHCFLMSEYKNTFLWIKTETVENRVSAELGAQRSLPAARRVHCGDGWPGWPGCGRPRGEERFLKRPWVALFWPLGLCPPGFKMFTAAQKPWPALSPPGSTGTHDGRLLSRGSSWGVIQLSLPLGSLQKKMGDPNKQQGGCSISSGNLSRGKQ